MIENLYLDLTEEKNDQKFYGKLFKSCKAAEEELYRADSGGRNRVIHLTVLHRQNYT